MRIHPSGSFILIIDDHVDLLDTLSMALEVEGYKVVTATNGQEALNYLKDHPSPCLILLDLTMPVMNGWEFRERQRQDPLLSLVPTVVVSGTEYDRNAISLDAVDYLDKPVDIEALMTTVAQHC